MLHPIHANAAWRKITWWCYQRARRFCDSHTILPSCQPASLRASMHGVVSRSAHSSVSCGSRGGGGGDQCASANPCAAPAPAAASSLKGQHAGRGEPLRAQQRVLRQQGGRGREWVREHGPHAACAARDQPLM